MQDQSRIVIKGLDNKIIIKLHVFLSCFSEMSIKKAFTGLMLASVPSFIQRLRYFEAYLPVTASITCRLSHFYDDPCRGLVYTRVGCKLICPGISSQHFRSVIQNRLAEAIDIDVTD